MSTTGQPRDNLEQALSRLQAQGVQGKRTLAMRRNRTGLPARRPNPLRELIAEKQRAAELGVSKRHVENLQQDLPAMISEQVGQHMERLETKLVGELKELGQKAVEQSAQILTEQLSERIDTLEQMSAMQSRSIIGLKTSSKIAEQKVGNVVDSIERTLSAAVPGGFELEPPKHQAGPHQPPKIPMNLQFVTEAGREHDRELVKADPRELTEMDDIPAGRYVFCPNCTSTKVRRAYRRGLWEEFLRLFFIAPFRCRACRYKFYRF